MTFERKILISSICMLAVTELAIYLSSWQPYSYLLPLILLIPTLVACKNVKFLQIKNSCLEEQHTKLEKNIKRLEDDTKVSQANEEEYKSIIDCMDGFIFSYHVLNQEWFYSQKFIEAFGEAKEMLSVIEEKLHQEDKKLFIKQREKWLSGSPATFEFRVVQPDEQIHWFELRSTSITSPSGEVEKIIGLVIDISERKEKEEKLAQMAFYDALTDLPNRTMLKDHLKKAIARAKRKEHEMTIMFLDLDGFKHVNDSFGHDVGDEFLKEVASRLNESVREEDLISRLGGDEFIIVFEDTSKEEVTGIADRITKNISQPYLLTEGNASVTPSIGISSFPEDGNDIHSLVQNADKAMYFVKNNGKGNYQFYTADLENCQPKESLIDKVLKFFMK